MRSIEKIVQDGKSEGLRRSSAHSLEAEKMGLRKSHPGIYEDVSEGKRSSQSPAGGRKSTTKSPDMILNLANMAKGVTENTAIQAAKDVTKVPEEIRK